MVKLISNSKKSPIDSLWKKNHKTWPKYRFLVHLFVSTWVHNGPLFVRQNAFSIIESRQYHRAPKPMVSVRNYLFTWQWRVQTRYLNQHRVHPSLSSLRGSTHRLCYVFSPSLDGEGIYQRIKHRRKITGICSILYFCNGGCVRFEGC